MKYGFDPKTNLDTTNISFPVAPQVSDVELEKCEYCYGNGWEGVDFHYTRNTPEGVSKLRDRTFCVNESNIRVSPNIPGDTVENAIEREYKKFNTRLKHIATKFNITEEELQSACNHCTTPMEFVEAYCNLINTKTDGVKLWLKTVVDNKGYTKVARYPSFLQRMDSGNCELSYTRAEQQIINNVTTPSEGSSEDDSWK